MKGLAAAVRLKYRQLNLQRPQNSRRSNIWIALNKIQRNTDELLKEHRALRNHYEELQKSLEFHINKVESLETENKALKKDIASLKQTVRNADEKIAEMNRPKRS